MVKKRISILLIIALMLSMCSISTGSYAKKKKIWLSKYSFNLTNKNRTYFYIYGAPNKKIKYTKITSSNENLVSTEVIDKTSVFLNRGSEYGHADLSVIVKLKKKLNGKKTYKFSLPVERQQDASATDPSNNPGATNPPVQTKTPKPTSPSGIYYTTPPNASSSAKPSGSPTKTPTMKPSASPTVTPKKTNNPSKTVQPNSTVSPKPNVTSKPTETLKPVVTAAPKDIIRITNADELISIGHSWDNSIREYYLNLDNPEDEWDWDDTKPTLMHRYLEGVTYSIENDIDMAGKTGFIDFFGGTLEGNGHCIKNLGRPLIYRNVGTIRNIQFTNINMDTDSIISYAKKEWETKSRENGLSPDDEYYDRAPSGNVILKECGRVGSIAVENYGSIEGCTASGTIQQTSSWPDYLPEICVGGLCCESYKGAYNGRIINSDNSVSVSLLGSHDYNETLFDCFAGGISCFFSGNMENCCNSAKIQGEGSAGGLICSIWSGEYHSICNCINSGDVLGKGEVAGGIAGQICGNGSIQRCINEGTVFGEARQTGGITAYLSAVPINTRITDCLNYGKVLGEGAGLANYSSYAIIHNFYNRGMCKYGICETSRGDAEREKVMQSVYCKQSNSEYVIKNQEIRDQYIQSVASLSDEDSKKESSFQGFDFTNTWIMTADGPDLRWRHS